MKLDIILIIMCFLFLFGAWVVTGGPSRPAATAGPFITPVEHQGEESQGYRGKVAPTNSTDANAYLRTGAGAPPPTTSSSGNYYYQRTPALASTTGN